MKNMKTQQSRWTRIFRVVLFTLCALAWSGSTFGGEIHSAAVNDDLDKLKLLLKGNPDLVFSKDGDGETPLHWAAANGHNDVVKFLLANKADVNAKDNSGDTPLHEAVGKGYEDTAELLLAGQADVNSKDKNDYTPLHYAVLGHQLTLVQLLVAKKADVNAKDNKSRTPAQWATVKGYNDIATWMQQHATQNAAASSRALPGTPGKIDIGGLPTVQDAASDGDLNKLKALLKDNPDLVFSRDKDGDTPLHLAAGNAHLPAVQFLLTDKADVNATNNLGQTPLHLAAANGDTNVTQFLLNHGADVNATNKRGQTPLFYATQFGGSSHEAVTALLRRHGGQ
jgi:ankyrin repeat protein